VKLQFGVIDLRTLLPWLAILGFSLLMLYSVSSPPGDFGLGEERAAYTVSRVFFERQLLWVGIGVITMLASAAVPFRVYKDYFAWLLYAGGLLLLLVLLVLPPLRGDTHRWLVLGPLSLQPSEFFKAALIIMLASFLAGRRGDPDRLSQLLLALALVLPPTLLVLRQPDLGTALTFIWLMFPMLLWRGLSLRRLIIMIAPLLSGAIVLYGETRPHEGLGTAHLIWALLMLGLFLLMLLSPRVPLVERIGFLLASIGVGLIVPRLWAGLLPYQQKRILVFFDPELDPLGAGYQIFQSKVAIGSGGLVGRGFLQGTQKGLAFLPARHTDFIFSVVGEEFGFVGALILLGLYAWLILRGFQVAGRARHPFAQLLAVGISSYLLFHVFVNIAMTTGLAPVTGLPLPGMSFGGSVLVATSFLLGLQMNIARNWGRY
jgi:rod shape determining protein RodA